MPTITLILETTPDLFGLWLEDATRYAKSFMSTVFLVTPDFARGGLYNGRWRWTVDAFLVSQVSSEMYKVSLYTFYVIPITPSRIKVKAEFGELGRDAFDALIARMREELPIVQPAAAPTPSQEAEGEASDAPKRKTRGTSKQTDANAREALRLYHDESLTQEVIAERKAVSVKTVKRWLKRARKLPKGTE